MDYTLQTHLLLLIFTECNAAAPWTTGDLRCFVNVDLVYFPKIVYFVFFLTTIVRFTFTRLVFLFSIKLLDSVIVAKEALLDVVMKT